MERGKDLEKIASANPDAETLKNIPVLFEDCVELWAGFFTLHRARQSGMSPCAIQLAEIEAYLRLVPVPYPVGFFVSAIQELDNVYLGSVNKKAEQRKRAQKTKAGGRMLPKK